VITILIVEICLNEMALLDQFFNVRKNGHHSENAFKHVNYLLELRIDSMMLSFFDPVAIDISYSLANVIS